MPNIFVSLMRSACKRPAVVLLLPAVTLTVLSLSILASLRLPEPKIPSVVSSSLNKFQQLHEGATKTTDHQDEPFLRDALCGGCYHTVAISESNVRCGLLIYNLILESKISLEEAAARVVSNYQACYRCKPTGCPAEEKRYWRYDATQKLPQILSSWVPSLQSLPSSSTIPSDALKDLPSFATRTQDKHQSTGFLFHYNPSVVALPDTFDRSSLAKNNKDVPAYVASFRVSTQQSCFHPHESMALYGGSWDKKPPTEDYLALAVLRSDFSIIGDVIVDVKGSGVFQHYAEDFRLFVFSNQLYLASFDLVAPIYISTVGVATRKGYVPLPALFPSPLQVLIRQFPSCPVCYNRPSNKCGAKSLNYFQTSSSNDGEVWVEVWPSGPHIVQEMKLEEPCSVSRKTQEATTIDHQTYTDAGSTPLTSWHTMEEVLFPSMEPSEVLLVRGRGGACCISMEDPRTGNDLLVGIFHTKVPKFGNRSGKRVPLWKQPGRNGTRLMTNQYLSRVYAFQTSAPFTVMAQSGLFCLGFPTSIQERDQQPLIQSTVWKTMVLGDVDLSCPRIHFVTGITVKADDPSRVLIGYGINDCFTRFIEVDKDEIARLLFPQAKL